jgi:hypothetical protein
LFFGAFHQSQGADNGETFMSTWRIPHGPAAGKDSQPYMCILKLSCFARVLAQHRSVNSLQSG